MLVFIDIGLRGHNYCHNYMLKNEKIFITGGAGFLGHQIIKRLYKDNEITVFSRDEHKHYFLKKQFPKVTCILGDIRNYELLNEAMKGHTIGIFAASLKQIDAVEQNPEEGIQVIIHGALNSRKAAINNKLKAATFVSTDKSRAPTTLYGGMKLVAEELFRMNAEKEKTRLSSVVFGNLLDSSGSIIPLIWDSIYNKYELQLFGKEMTRFITGNDSAVDSILVALEHSGCSIIPHMESIKVLDLFEIYEEEFGLKWKLGKPRVSEKIHEHAMSLHEVPKTKIVERKGSKYYLVHYKDIYNTLSEEDIAITSEKTMTKKQLKAFLKERDYFRPKTTLVNFPKLIS